MNADTPSEADSLRQEHALFLRTMAHALRTPLQSLQGFAELVEPGLPHAQLEMYLSFIKRGTAQLAAVVDDLCLWHELERGPLALYPGVIDVGAFLADLARAFEFQVPDCVIALEYADDMPPAYADSDRLAYVLCTLLRIAEYSRPDLSQPAALTVCARFDPATKEVVFAVEAVGARSPSEFAAALFDPTPRLPVNLRWCWAGTGLGLYAAREVARQMGGELCLASTAPGGQQDSTFQLRVPAYPGEGGHA